MDYKNLIEKALNGRSVNKAAHDWGIPQKTLDNYVKGTRLPDYQTALIIAAEAGIEAGEMMKVCAAEEAKKKPRPMYEEMEVMVERRRIELPTFALRTRKALSLAGRATQYGRWRH
jgi:protein-disulfide isomerase-like protein with CxxC motif